MLYRLLSDLIVVVHLGFVLFAALGGFLVLKWKGLAWLHVPACVWAAFMEFAGLVCPLTPLENWLRDKGGGLAYRTGFIEHYILPVLYPVILTRNLQIFLGLLVLWVNLGIYGYIGWHARQSKIKGS